MIFSPCLGLLVRHLNTVHWNHSEEEERKEKKERKARQVKLQLTVCVLRVVCQDCVYSLV